MKLREGLPRRPVRVGSPSVERRSGVRTRSRSVEARSYVGWRPKSYGRSKELRVVASSYGRRKCTLFLVAIHLVTSNYRYYSSFSANFNSPVEEPGSSSIGKKAFENPKKKSSRSVLSCRCLLQRFGRMASIHDLKSTQTRRSVPRLTFSDRTPSFSFRPSSRIPAIELTEAEDTTPSSPCESPRSHTSCALLSAVAG